jgi:hypothetical protein
MIKPLTFSLGLAIALGLSSVSLAGGHGKSMPSPQDPIPSAQVMPTGQDLGGCDGADVCGPVKHCKLFDLFKPKPACYTYEWVLKKKRVHSWPKLGGLFGKGCGDGCGDTACDACGGSILPSGQGPSPQGYAAPAPAPQSFGAPTNYATKQAYGAPAPQAYGVPAPVSAPQAQPMLQPVADPAAEPPTLPVTSPKAADAGGLLLLNPAGF